MKIIDVTPATEDIYFCCLEEWSDDIKEAGDHKACWYRKFRDKGLRVKLAVDTDGTIGGMIQYLPAEYTFVDAEGCYLILCTWVHGHKKGRGDFRKKGMGKALLHAAEEDCKQMGKRGLAAWGISLPFFMRAAWYRKQGYSVVDKDGIIRLLWKPFSNPDNPPKLIKQKMSPDPVPGKVGVSVFINGWCPAQNLVYERIKKAIIDHLDKIELTVYHTDDIEIMKHWGISDALFIDGKEVSTGPPPSLKKLRKIIDAKISHIA